MVMIWSTSEATVIQNGRWQVETSKSASCKFILKISFTKGGIPYRDSFIMLRLIAVKFPGWRLFRISKNFTLMIALPYLNLFLGKWMHTAERVLRLYWSVLSYFRTQSSEKKCGKIQNCLTAAACSEPYHYERISVGYPAFSSQDMGF